MVKHDMDYSLGDTWNHSADHPPEVPVRNNLIAQSHGASDGQFWINLWKS